MIVTGEVENILYKDLREFGQPYKNGTEPTGIVTSERIQIIVKDQSKSKYWNSGFVEVNFLVPNIDGKPNTRRLVEVEKSLSKLEKYGRYNGQAYAYETYSITRLEDKELKCWFANCRILFESLNTKL